MRTETPPVLLTAFNRTDTLEPVLRALGASAPSRLYVACDGPRTHVAGEAQRVQAVCEMLSNPPWRCEVRTRFLEENHGCGRAMSGAIGWFFEHEERGVVLEDDCLPAAGFLQFCAEMLERHAGDERVMSVLGTRHACARPGQRESYSFSRLFAPWGWASWRRAWSRYRFDLSGWRAEFGPKGLASRGLPSASVRGWSRKFDWPASHGAVAPAWAYQFTYAHLKHDGLCVLPAVNMVSNIGDGMGATHMVKRSVWSGLPLGTLEFPLVHPQTVVHDAHADGLRERHHMNHRPWLARKFFAVRRSLGLVDARRERGW
ncbi:MAG: nucleotide-diphospho-sugar transferase [Planctomycetota bacterium]